MHHFIVKTIVASGTHLPQQIIMVCLLLFIVPVSADPDVTDHTRSTSQQSPTLYTTDIQRSQLNTTQTLQSLVSQWQISEAEYRRYQALMQGPLGRWNPNLDPVLALGISASTDAEKRRYAELYAKQEYHLTTQTLVFEQFYRSAWKQLYPQAPVINHEALQPYYHHQAQKQHSRNAVMTRQPAFQDNDRLLYFPSIHCSGCGQVIARILDHVSTFNVTVDVYVRYAQNDEAVRQWAISNGIDQQWLSSQRLTLNRDEGLWSRLHSRHGNATESLTYMIRDDQIHSLNYRTFDL